MEETRLCSVFTSTLSITFSYPSCSLFLLKLDIIWKFGYQNVVRWWKMSFPRLKGCFMVKWHMISELIWLLTPTIQHKRLVFSVYVSSESINNHNQNIIILHQDANWFSRWGYLKTKNKRVLQRFIIDLRFRNGSSWDIQTCMSQAPSFPQVRYGRYLSRSSLGSAWKTFFSECPLNG